MKKGVWFALFVVSLLTLVPALAQSPFDGVLVNSKDWKDVYSGIMYGKLAGAKTNFLVSERHALIYFQTLNSNLANRLIVEGDQIYFSGLERSLENIGFNVERIAESNNNLALAQRVVDERGINSFIILSDAYGYNAVSAAGYAVLSKSYVLFVNEFIIDDIVDFLEDVEVESLIVAGRMPRSITSELEQFNPEILEGESRFEINVAFARKHREISNLQQVAVTNGEFIEDQLMSGIEPVIFIGQNNLPTITEQYLQSSDVKVAVLVGNDLVQTATKIRRQLGITTFVKFARTARIPSGTLSQVEGLDLFYLPQYDMSMDITNIQYNELARTLEVTYENTADIALYFSSTLTITDGEDTTTLGDEEPIFMDIGESRTVTYAYDSQTTDLSVSALVVYGESSTSMDKALEKTMEVGLVRILDESELQLVSAFYTRKDKAVGVVVRNPGNVDVFAGLELKDFYIDGLRQDVGSKKTTLVRAGEERTLYVRAKLTNLDIEDNPRIRALVRYGQRETALIKSLEGQLDMIVEGFEYAVEAGIALAVIITIILLWFLLGKRRKRKKKHH